MSEDIEINIYIINIKIYNCINSYEFNLIDYCIFF